MEPQAGNQEVKYDAWHEEIYDSDLVQRMSNEKADFQIGCSVVGKSQCYISLIILCIMMSDVKITFVQLSLCSTLVHALINIFIIYHKYCETKIG